MRGGGVALGDLGMVRDIRISAVALLLRCVYLALFWCLCCWFLAALVSAC